MAESDRIKWDQQYAPVHSWPLAQLPGRFRSTRGMGLAIGCRHSGHGRRYAIWPIKEPGPRP